MLFRYCILRTDRKQARDFPMTYSDVIAMVHCLWVYCEWYCACVPSKTEVQFSISRVIKDGLRVF
jgi:hypothetical protein